MSIKLVTYDVYIALLDIEGSLQPVVQEALSFDADVATTFVRLWRTKQMERAAISNSLGRRLAYLLVNVRPWLSTTALVAITYQ